jgi:transposase
MELPRQYYTEEFKQEAVKLIRESGLKLTEAAKRLNIPSQTLKNWIYRDPAKNASQVSSSRRPVTELESEITRLNPCLTPVAHFYS